MYTHLCVNKCIAIRVHGAAVNFAILSNSPSAHCSSAGGRNVPTLETIRGACRAARPLICRWSRTDTREIEKGPFGIDPSIVRRCFALERFRACIAPEPFILRCLCRWHPRRDAVTRRSKDFRYFGCASTMGRYRRGSRRIRTRLPEGFVTEPHLRSDTIDRVNCMDSGLHLAFRKFIVELIIRYTGKTF